MHRSGNSFKVISQLKTMLSVLNTVYFYNSSSESVSTPAGATNLGASFGFLLAKGRSLLAGGCATFFAGLGCRAGTGAGIGSSTLPPSAISWSESSSSLAEAVASVVWPSSVSSGSDLMRGSSSILASAGSSSSDSSLAGAAAFLFPARDAAGLRALPFGFGGSCSGSGDGSRGSSCLDAAKGPDARSFCCSLILTFFSFSRSRNFWSSTVSSSSFALSSSSN